jgi:hypothetical protein
MTANLYDDDPYRDAAMIAEQWADQYKGRRRISDEALADLVEAEIARFRDQNALAVMLTTQAARRMGGWEHVVTARATARREAEERLAETFDVQMGLMLGATLERCPDPSGHDRLEDTAAQELRPSSPAGPDECRWCGGVR